MNFDTKEFTLLDKDQVFGSDRIDLISNIGAKCAITDFAILLGAYAPDDYYVDYDNSLKGRIGFYYLSSPDSNGNVRAVYEDDNYKWANAGDRSGGIRPALPFSTISNISTNGVRGRSGILEVEYGEYPQYVVSTSMESELEQAYRSGTIRKTGKTYTTDSRNWHEHSSPFKAIEHEEYEYNGRKYIRTYYRDSYTYTLSNGKQYEEGDNVWIEVSPLKWYVDNDAKIMLCKNLIASGIRFCDDRNYDGNFKNTEMYNFLNTYFARDIEPSVILQMTRYDFRRKSKI